MMFLWSLLSLSVQASEQLYRKLSANHSIYTRPQFNASVRGYALNGAVVEVVEELSRSSSSACSSGWARLEQGYLCLDSTERFTPIDDLEDGVELLSWDPPDPQLADEDYRMETWEPKRAIEPFVPRLHARIKEGFRGRLWASAEAYGSGERPNWRLKADRDYSFVDLVETDRGWVLVRPNGRVSPLEEWSVYPVSRFEGRVLSYDPIPSEQQAGWVINPEGTTIYQGPSKKADALWMGRFQESLNVRVYDELWYELPDILGTGKHAYLLRQDVYTWNAQPLPERVEEDDIWVDVDIEQQILAVMQGEEPLFLTLISSAKAEFETPLGIYAVYKKSLAWDLASKPDAEDEVYYLEQVPWVMHYYPRYALHTAFWHDQFGIPSSHGCINLSPKDAAYVFDYLNPELPSGWKRTERFSGEIGSIVRIRNGEEIDVPERIVRGF